MSEVNPKLAKELFTYLTRSEASLFYLSKVRKICKKHDNNRRECFIEAAKLFGKPKNNDQLYMVSQCYVNAGADYRPQAIIYLKKFIAAGAVWSGTTTGTIDCEDHIESQLSICKSSIWCQLGKAYEGEYMFVEARNAYLTALQIDPFCTPAICGVADTYLKMNDLDGGIKYLSQFTKSKYKDLKMISKAELKTLKEKKAAGYVYKPRPRKTNGK